MPALDLSIRPKRRDGVRLRRVGNRVVLILDSRGVELNETAEAVWRLCSGEASLHSIAGSIAGEYDVEPDQVVDDVVELVQELQALNAVDLDPEA